MSLRSGLEWFNSAIRSNCSLHTRNLYPILNVCICTIYTQAHTYHTYMYTLTPHPHTQHTQTILTSHIHRHTLTFLCKSLRALPSSTPRLVFLNPTWLLRLRDNVPLSEGARRSRGDWLPDRVRLGEELMIQTHRRLKSVRERWVLAEVGWLSRVVYWNADLFSK